MKHVLISAVVAVILILIAFQLEDALDRDGDGDGDDASISSAVGAGQPFALMYTDELIEDAWVNGARGAGLDHKPLAHAGNSVCYLTKVEIRGAQGPDASNACRIEVDEFTRYWEVIAEVEEGGQSEVRCNARCLVWE